MRGRFPLRPADAGDEGLDGLRLSGDSGDFPAPFDALPSVFFPGFPSGFCLTDFKIGLQSYDFWGKNGHFHTASTGIFEGPAKAVAEMLLLRLSQQLTL